MSQILNLFSQDNNLELKAQVKMDFSIKAVRRPFTCSKAFQLLNQDWYFSFGLHLSLASPQTNNIHIWDGVGLPSVVLSTKHQGPHILPLTSGEQPSATTVGPEGDTPVTHGDLFSGCNSAKWRDIYLCSCCLQRSLVIMQTFLDRSIQPFTYKGVHDMELLTERNSYPQRICPSQQVLLKQMGHRVRAEGLVSRMETAWRRKTTHFILKPYKAGTRISNLQSSLCYLGSKTGSELCLSVSCWYLSLSTMLAHS